MTQIICKLMIIVFVGACSFINVFAESLMNEGVVVFTAYLRQADDQHAEFYSQQALIMYDLERQSVLDWIYIPDGSLVTADLKDKGYVYVVPSSGYGIIKSQHYYYSGSYSPSIYQFLITDNRFYLTDRKVADIDNNSFIVGIDDWSYYLMECSDDYEFKICTILHQELVDIGSYFDGWNEWSWPCDFISINSDMNIALLRYDSWGDESHLKVYDLKNGNILQDTYADIQGPICWINESALLTWEWSENDEFCACLYNLSDDTLTRLFTSSMRPVFSSDVQNDKVVYWTMDMDEGSVSLRITCFDGMDESLMTLYLAEDDETCYLTYFTDVNGIEYQIRVPFNLYQPTVFWAQ